MARRGVWVVAAAPKPEIIFTESVAKFLWWNHVASLHTYEGLWDPWPAVEASAARELTETFQIDARAVPVGGAERDQLLASVSSAYVAAVDQGPEAFFKWLAEPAPAQGELIRAQGGSYLMEIWLEPGVGRDSWVGAYVTLHGTCRLIRDDGTIVWTSSGFASEALEPFEDYRKLVERDFAVMQGALDQALVNLVSAKSGWSPFASFLPLPDNR